MSLTRAGVVHAVQSAAPKRLSDTQEITGHKRRLNTRKKSSVVKCTLELLRYADCTRGKRRLHVKGTVICKQGQHNGHSISHKASVNDLVGTAVIGKLITF